MPKKRDPKAFVTWPVHPDPKDVPVTRVKEITLAADGSIEEHLERLRQYGMAEIVSPERVTVLVAWDPANGREVQDDLDGVPHETVRSGTVHAPFDAIHRLDNLHWLDADEDS